METQKHIISQEHTPATNGSNGSESFIREPYFYPVYDVKPTITADSALTVVDPKVTLQTVTDQLPSIDDGSTRVIVNLISADKPSDANPDFVKILRSVVRHDGPVPVGLINFETDVAVEDIASLTENLNGVIERFVDHNEEVWVDIPNVKNHFLDQEIQEEEAYRRDFQSTKQEPKVIVSFEPIDDGKAVAD